MAGKKKTSPSKAKAGPSDFGGLDPELMKAIMGNIPPNPVTGRVEMQDIMKYMTNNPAEMEELVSQMNGLKTQEGSVDLASYDYASLAKTIKHESFWVVQLEHMGFTDSSGAPVDPSMAGSSSNVRQLFIIYVYDEKGGFRLTQDCTGLPDSDLLLQTIRRAIAQPLPPFKPCLPWFLMVSIKFKPHVPNIRPFLDSLPPPFHWRLETLDEASTVSDGVYKLNEEGVRIAQDFAAKRKRTGDEAMAKGDRAAALKAYEEAIDNLADALLDNPNINEKDIRNAKRQLIGCYTRHAKALMLKS
ncbi:hypothetical protein PLICRDRAFT_330928 [Plicaturopsis crispa FD-325 SS-3]|uniref:MIT domain-containing protein n=1 Tax=Plicaturopsis crispa FD-325 SS-3 TaxID=944288 RepID=A0A0C9T6Y2_PLICR|nr:hypothetical protein PLICRDRAFT_330928 [Plicaturopsis crispa FD-325 SS-3]